MQQRYLSTMLETAKEYGRIYQIGTEELERLPKQLR